MSIVFYIRYRVTSMDMGTRFKEARLSVNLKQEQFVDETGISRQTVSQVENNKQVPSTDTCIAWAKRTGASLDWLLTGEASPGGHVLAIKEEPRPVTPTEALKALKSLVYDTERLRRQVEEQAEELALLRQPTLEPLEVLQSKNDAVTVMSEERRRRSSRFATSRDTGDA